MTADAFTLFVRARHHDGGVPANDSPDPSLHFLVAREPWLLVGGYGVDVRRRHQRPHRHLKAATPLHHLPDDEARAARSFAGHECVERLKPLAGLLWVRVRKLVKES